MSGAHLVDICRHPIKSVGYEQIQGVHLSAGHALPYDRHWAVAHARAPFGAAPPGWEPKTHFLRGAASAELMAIRAEFDECARRITLHHPRAGSLTVTPARDGDTARLIDWLVPLWPENRPVPAHLVRQPMGALADNPEPFVAILNHASNRALGQRLGRDLSIHRWRGNLWLEGLAPWEEFDLLGREVRIGGARLKVVAPITRCKATTANPETGRFDADTLGALDAGYGHQDFGVFALVTEGGEVRCGDSLEILP